MSNFKTPKFLIMKYFNKTRTIEQKITYREELALLQKQVVLLEKILIQLQKQV